jgi:hypothetical protein
MNKSTEAELVVAVLVIRKVEEAVFATKLNAMDCV